MIRRPTAWALAALPAAACLSTPSYKPEAAVSYTPDGPGATAGATVAGTGFTLHFAAAAGTGFHLPDGLTIDGADVLGHDKSASCFDENEAGFQLSPAYRISGDSGASATSITRNELHPVLRGPAVVQVELDWAMHLGTSSHTTSGTSTFTVFLDGRIVRHDHLEDSGPMPATVDECRCLPGTGDEFDISAYWTFSQAALPSFSAPPPAVSQLLPDANGIPSACFLGTGYQVAAAFRVPDSEVNTDLLSIRDTGTLFKYLHFNAIGASQIDRLSWDNRSALFIERSNCMRALGRADEYLHLTPLTINKNPVMPSENDGIYGGDPGNGHPGYVLGTNRAVITGDLASSFAVWLSFASSVDLLRATRTGGAAPTGAWYIPQQIDSRTWIVWFRDPLAATQQIVIEPN